jgi:two-component system nitrogen regulation response regulator NtrX
MKVLFVDDEIESKLQNTFGNMQAYYGVENVFSSKYADDALAFLKTHSEEIDLIFIDHYLGGSNINGLDLGKIIGEKFPFIAIIMVTGEANKVEICQEAMRSGFSDFLDKGKFIKERAIIFPEFDRIGLLPSIIIKQKTKSEYVANKKLRFELKELSQIVLDKRKPSLNLDKELIGNSKQINLIKSFIQAYAATDETVLILGENGTGKELVAKNIHLLSDRSKQPYITVNCAAIPEALIESELFGHKKGSFTDAIAKKGKFELANFGTLFLDEIGDLSLSAQAKILRAIQEKKITPVGGESDVDVNIRIICATNKNLVSLVKKEKFREDLYNRIRSIFPKLPELKERKEDIIELLNHWSIQYIEAAYKAGRNQQSAKWKALSDDKKYLFFFTEDSIEMIKERNWPGNVRELKRFFSSIVTVIYPFVERNPINHLYLKECLEMWEAKETKPETGQETFAIIENIQPLQNGQSVLDVYSTIKQKNRDLFFTFWDKVGEIFTSEIPSSESAESIAQKLFELDLIHGNTNPSKSLKDAKLAHHSSMCIALNMPHNKHKHILKWAYNKKGYRKGMDKCLQNFSDGLEKFNIIVNS